MKTGNLFIVLISLVIFNACKEDYAFEDGVILPPTEPEFYVNGTCYFNDGDVHLFDYQSGEPVLLDVDPENTYGSGVIQGVDNGKTFIASMVGTESWRFNLTTVGAGINLLNHISHGLYIKVFRNQSASTNNGKLTKGELLELFQVGNSLNFGEDYGQVEVGFETPDLDEETIASIPWINPIISGTTNDKNAENVVEILSVEEYEGPTQDKGLKVKVKFDANLTNHLWEESSIQLRDVEGVFFFEYQ